MVGYLAGRQGRGAESIRRELEDPTSEASRWLLALQRKSQAVSKIAFPKVQAVASPAAMRNGMITRQSGKKSSLAFLSGFSVATLAFVALSLAWRVQENRLLRLESMLKEREAWWTSRMAQLNEALTPRKEIPRAETQKTKQSGVPQAKPPAAVDGQAVLALARIEARLTEVGDRLSEAQSGQNQSDPMIAELRRDIDQLRKEIETTAQTNRQENQELRMVVQEVLQLLRRLSIGPWGPGPMQVPFPEQLQEHQRRGGQRQGVLPGGELLPGLGHNPERERFFVNPGEVSRERYNQGITGGYTGPRMQRPGAPG
jgi:hypothetical protein